MKSWIRIAVVVFALIGGTAYFGYWTLAQFNEAFDNLSAPHYASVLTITPSITSSLESDTVPVASE